MIKIKSPKDCCGCEACRQICPKGCIDFVADKQGFLYPKVDIEKCIDCGLCNRVCPMVNHGEEKKPEACYAGWNKNEEIRLKSSSGGIFTALAENVLNDGGVVFGARFNDHQEVIHDYTTTIDGLFAFRGSKYVQSRIGDTFTQVKQFLNDGRRVLFTGTACQVMGLRNFLRKDYDNLLLVDVICHGVPSPLVWKVFIEHEKRRFIALVRLTLNAPEKVSSPMVKISFRDKQLGWKDGSVKKEFSLSKNRIHLIYSKRIVDDEFGLLFLHNYILRPSCYACACKSGKCGSDITIGDFWGIDDLYPHLDDDKGCSAIMVNSEKGEKLLSGLPLTKHPVKYEEILLNNPPIERSFELPPRSKKFWRDFVRSDNKFDVILEYNKPEEPSIKEKILWNIKNRLKLRK